MQRVLLVFLFIIFATTSQAQKFKVKENSRLARTIGRLKGERDKYAITFGKTIFVSCKKEEFFAQDWWVRHELAHVEQYKKHGVFGFLKLYLIYSIKHDYYEIPFEKEAIAAEYVED